MSYEVIKLASDKLTYREKMKLAQYLIQAAIKEEETFRPTERSVDTSESKQSKVSENNKDLSGKELILYAKERLAKSKPAKTQSLNNFIAAMFQFQGGIEESKIENIVKGLEKDGFLSINGTKVSYA
ncbi:hypothetical protein KUV95_17250 [Microbulbifer agarilyticus]|uniref:hypothetical protein n=1 Tax=Microbulbifer agarilyticus TaxID=260552 RepID=UPI001C956782|nr:hypothetical protein [Microbulbifer agarilyticus]MBY6213293.1 hypothetical protein [Microbulbifer agarilyticus]